MLLCCCFFARIWLEIRLIFLFIFWPSSFFLVSLFVVVFLVLDVVSLSVAHLDATDAVFPDRDVCVRVVIRPVSCSLYQFGCDCGGE